MRDVVRGTVVGLVLFGLLGAIASRAGWATIDVPRPDGTAPWFVSRAAGFAAFTALALDVIVGLLVSTKAGDRWITRAHAIDLHGWLSPVALALVIGHAAILLVDGYIRFDLLDLVVPFVAPYRPLAVGIGVIAAYLALVVHASFGLRRRLGTRTWRRLHYLSFAAFVASSLHAMLAGSDRSRPWAIALHGSLLAIVGALIAYRVLLSRQRAHATPQRNAR
jgi:predicted ferric reductase